MRQHLYTSLQAANVARQAEWDPASATNTLLYRATELGGEVGEALNVVKKLERFRLGVPGSRDTLHHLGQELADVVICAYLTASVAGLDLDEAIRDKFNDTTEKMGLTTYLAAPT